MLDRCSPILALLRLHPDGLTSTELAAALQIKPVTMSTRLSRLATYCIEMEPGLRVELVRNRHPKKPVWRLAKVDHATKTVQPLWGRE